MKISTLTTRLLTLALVVTLSFILPEAHAQQRLAVFDFQVKNAMSQSEAQTLTNKFRNEMGKTKLYTMVERSAMEQVLSEQRFSASDLADQDKAVQLGKLLSASKVVVGDIGQVGQTYSVFVRLIDVQTASIERSESLEYQGRLDGLFEEFEILAQKLAGTYKEKKKRTWLYLAGIGLVGGAAGVYFLTSGGGDEAAGLPTPPSPPN